MSKITLTKKANGRYYLGFGSDELIYLRLLVAKPVKQNPASTPTAIHRLAKALSKPARGEA